MSHAKRSDGDGEVDAASAMQYLRASEHGDAPKKKDDDQQISVFWRVFGGTLLSICALVGVTGFNNLMSTLGDLRSEVNKGNEARTALAFDLRNEIAKAHEGRSEFVKKDELAAKTTSMWDRIAAMQTLNNGQDTSLTGVKTEVDGLKDRLAKTSTDLETARKDHSAACEILKKDVAAIESLKEKLAALAADEKACHDDLSKVKQEVERNKTYDLERKQFRDSQAKQIDESLKELAKAVQDCRERIARLEAVTGQTPPASGSKVSNPTRAVPVRPASFQAPAGKGKPGDSPPAEEKPPAEDD